MFFSSNNYKIIELNVQELPCNINHVCNFYILD